MDDTSYARLLLQAMTDLAKAPAEMTDVDAALRDITCSCVESVTGSHSADVLLISGPDDHRSLAATSDLVQQLDELQRLCREGPCMDAASGQSIVRCDDLEVGPRWPRFAEAAVAMGAHSMLSLHIATHDDRAAALNIVGRKPNCFSPDAEALCAVFATRVSMVLTVSEREHQFRSALASRDVIGQAKGQIMERFNVDADRAFDLLVRLSQEFNTRVADVAAELVARGSDAQGVP